MTINAYFAHPFFTEEQKQNTSNLLSSLTDIGEVRIINPFDFLPPVESDPKVKSVMGKLILNTNLQLIDSSDLMIAVIDDRDLGVAVEIGYALARQIPIISVSYKEYDMNIMLKDSVLIHITNVLESNLLSKTLRTLSSVDSIS